MSDDIDTIDPNDPVFQLPPYTLEYVAVSLAETVDWGLNAFKVPELWKITKGKGIKVAVLDTGAALGHPDLAAAIASAKDFTGSAFGPDDKKSGHGCVSPECLIHTSINGVEKIEDFYDRLNVKERRVRTIEGEYLVKDVSAKTISLDAESQKTVVGEITSVQKLPISGEIVEIQLEGNIRYKLTPWHPVYLLERKNNTSYRVIRKRADEIELGDWFIPGDGEADLNTSPTMLKLPTKAVCGNCGHTPRWKKTKGGQCKKCLRTRWTWPDRAIEVSEDLAYLAGIVITDGYVCKDRFEVCSITPEILSRVEVISHKQGWTTLREERRILVYSLDAVAVMAALGIQPGRKSLTKELPAWTGTCSKGVAHAFLAGVIDGDGSLSKNNVKGRITTASPSFTHKMTAWMNSLGIRTSSGTPSCSNRLRFIRRRVSTKLKTQDGETSVIEFKTSELHDKVPVFKITHGALPAGVIKHLQHPEKARRAIIPVSHRYKGRRVKNVEKKHYEGFFYDFTVKDHHNYLAEGHFVSNSHCAGIVGARQNNTGIVGVAPEVSLYIAKVLGDNGAGSMASIIAGIQWSIDQKVDIISMSLGSSQGYSKLQDIIKVATAAGIIVICAAGNEGPGPNTVGYPANYPEVISVAAIGKNLTVTNFSSRGNRIDVAAPGDNILSCYPPTGYAALSGTSMATPFVAGLAALLLAVDRLSGNPVINNTEDFRQILKTYSIDAGPAGKDTAYGWGLVNPEEYFKAIKKPEAPTEPTPDIKKVTLFDEDLTNSGVVKLVYASGDSIGPDGIEVTVK